MKHQFTKADLCLTQVKNLVEKTVRGLAVTHFYLPQTQFKPESQNQCEKVNPWETKKLAKPSTPLGEILSVIYTSANFGFG